jgi:hypothetical protein
MVVGFLNCILGQFGWSDQTRERNLRLPSLMRRHRPPRLSFYPRIPSPTSSHERAGLGSFSKSSLPRFRSSILQRVSGFRDTPGKVLSRKTRSLSPQISGPVDLGKTRDRYDSRFEILKGIGTRARVARLQGAASRGRKFRGRPRQQAAKEGHNELVTAARRLTFHAQKFHSDPPRNRQQTHPMRLQNFPAAVLFRVAAPSFKTNQQGNHSLDGSA